MRFVEEEHQLGFDGIPDLRKLFEQLAHQPKQEGGVESGAGHELVGRQNVDVSQSGPIGTHQIAERQRRLAKQF